MIKRILLCACCALCVLPAPAKCEEPLRRSLFVSVIQDPPVLSSREEILKLVDFAKKARIDTLFVQVYRANQAWFPSKVADAGPYETCLENVSEDPFALLIKEAHAAGIRVHAWLNLLSLGANRDAAILRKYRTGILTRNTAVKKTLEDYKIDDQYFLEPGDPRVRDTLVAMVTEVLSAYPGLDGIQFDYIRYPDKDPAYGYTRMNLGRFKEATGIQAARETSGEWRAWKRDQVTGLLEELVVRSRAIRPDIQVSATGCAPYVRAYLEAFQDWPSWLERGLVDFVTVMSYSADTAEFERYILEAKRHVGDFRKIVVGIGAYEMAGSPEVFAREVEFCKKAGVRSCAVFHYGSIVENPAMGSLLAACE